MSLILSRMQNFRAVSNLDKWEERPSRYGAWDLFLRETANPMGIISPELRARANQSQGNTLEVPVYDKDGSVTINNTRTVTISDDENTTAMQSITFTTYEFGFTMIPAQYSNNEMAYQRDFNQKMTKYTNALLATLDTAAVSALSTAKTQVLADNLGRYTFASNTVNALDSQRLRIIADINPLMAANDFFEPRHIVGNPGLLSLFLEIQESGLYNQQNRVIQWADKELHFTNRLSDATNKVATGYVVNSGSVGIVDRLDRDTVMQHTTHKHQFYPVNVPGIGVTMGLYYYDDVADKNTITGAATADLTRTKVEAYSFSVDIAIVTAYNSDAATYAGPVLKFDIDSDDTL